MERKAGAIRSRNDKTEYLCVIRIYKGICHLRKGAQTEDIEEINRSINIFKQILTLPHIEHFPQHINTINGYIIFASWEIGKLN